MTLLDITGPLTVPIILQYLEARQRIDVIQLNAEEPDRFTWRWTASGQFSSKSAYDAMFASESSILGVKEPWKSRAPNRCRFFIWLSLLGRSWTSDRLFSHGLRSDDVCALCSQEPEMIDHLLCQCVFSREVWFNALRHAGWQHLAPSSEDTYARWWLRVRMQIPKPQRAALDSYVILVAWCIWRERNQRVQQ
jgi:hypothetical protein